MMLVQEESAALIMHAKTLVRDLNEAVRNLPDDIEVTFTTLDFRSMRHSGTREYLEMELKRAL